MAREEEESEEYGGPYYEQPDLGDLTRPIAHERGELWARDPTGRLPRGPGGPSQVADLARGQRIIGDIQDETMSRVAPALAYQVQSTYDARPVQSYDFQDGECSNITWAGTPPIFAPFNAVSFMVPDNTIAVIRHFQYMVIDPPVNAVVEGDCWLQSDIIINDLPVREYTRMVHPVIMEDAFPIFVIADERNRVNLQLSIFVEPGGTTEFAQALDGFRSPVIANLFGNIILKTGIPKEFEIANKIV